jgi:hypothetical protein
MRAAAALAAAFVIAIAGCAHHLAAPAGYVWDLPVYPGAKIEGKSAAKASFVLYRTPDAIDDVYAWYVAQLPQGTPHAYSPEKHQATFALFDARSRRTVHIQANGSATAIILTKLNDP